MTRSGLMESRELIIHNWLLTIRSKYTDDIELHPAASCSSELGGLSSQRGRNEAQCAHRGAGMRLSVLTEGQE